MTKQEILASLRECAAKLGRAPKQADLRKMTKITRHWILRHFTDVTDAYREAGILRVGAPHRIDTQTLLEDWVKVARSVKRLPSRSDYLNQGKYSGVPFFRLCGQWSRVPDYLRAFARERRLEGKWGDVLKMIGSRGKAVSQVVWAKPPAGPTDPTNTALSNDVGFSNVNHVNDNHANHANRANEDVPPTALPALRRRGVRVDRPVYGRPCSLLGLRYEPVNELGVVYVFGMVAPRLGLQVERMQQAFPDCEAVREVGPGRWQRVRIEFEYASRNFLPHNHRSGGCDMIVCWTHNWPECPKELEVIELQRIVRGM
jgi:hypothetical protein